jgi:hypothetical protein
MVVLMVAFGITGWDILADILAPFFLRQLSH